MFEFLPEGRFLTDFEVDDHLLGSGGFGCVYKCKHKLDLQNYAVKVVKILKKTKKKILREAQFLASVEHQSIVRYYQDAEEEDEIDTDEEEAVFGTEGNLLFSGSVEKGVVSLLFIQMELCHGNLSEKLENLVDNPELAYNWFRQFMEGLSHLHSLGIAHNDLSTKNIFLDKNNNAKIGDLGVAKEVGSTILTEDSLGAELYRAPEKKKGVPINSKMDIFSAGVILYELLYPIKTGFERCLLLQANREKGELPIDGHSGIDLLVKNMVSHHPRERPTASDVLALLPEIKNEFVGSLDRRLRGI
ncbi:hypothetical protein SLEP1_g37024 [Rubroshorea leprosula]|uniref:Protein kinase domain-containing protein n=1 Tax=Rubroshorea leprosula TaxID=152421 RepID=A0AAV5KTD9_9ROSI|nr:hypothetical protein SLEP1_g37024 [Rubroshorea leprosula]